MNTILDVKDLVISFENDGQMVEAVRNISFNVSANQLSINSRFNPKFFNFQKNTKEIFKSKNFDKIIDF